MVSASPGSSGLAVGQLDAAAGQKRPDAVLALLAVDVFAVVGVRVEGHELFAGALGALFAGRRRTWPSRPWCARSRCR